jgi:hypothetical protein
MKIIELREKYKAYLPMIYEKLSDKIHDVRILDQMSADGIVYDSGEIRYIRQRWAPVDGSPVEFVCVLATTFLLLAAFWLFVRSSANLFRME